MRAAMPLREQRGLGFALGALGVTIFAMTLPMTRLAVGDAAAPQLAPAFVTAGRAAVALCAAGTVIGFPLLLLALRKVDALHAAIVTGVLPLGTLPLSLPAALCSWPVQALQGSAWLGFAYVSVFSMWLGFFARYRGRAIGGVLRVSQVQLLQPFLALLFAVPVLGETLEPVTLGCALAVIAIVFVGRRMPVGQPA